MRLNMRCGYIFSVSLSPFQLFESYLMQKNDYYLSGGQLANGDTWGRHCLPAKCFLMVGVKADPATSNQHTCTRSQWTAGSDMELLNSETVHLYS